MVRVAIIALTLTHSLADEDVYHHTQLLQTKVSPQKVAVDADGVKDHVTLFQNSYLKKLYQSSKKTAYKKIMSLVEGRKKKGDWSSYSSYDSKGDWSSYDWSSYDSYGDWSSYDWSSYSGSIPPFVEQQAKDYYGDDVDVQKFFDCSKKDFDTDSGSWHPDPNKGMKTVSDAMDECVGSTNLLTEKCQGEYGKDVGLFDCMMCGLECQCKSPDECDLTCHRDCMSKDEAAWEYESSYDSDWGSSYSYDSSSYGDHEDGMCKLFYGEDGVDKCEDCGDKCWETTFSDSGSETYGSSVTYEQEKAFWEGFGSCMDKCVGMPNLVTAACKAGYGDDVDVFECTSCGMACDCSLDGCEASDDSSTYKEGFECHKTCMDDDWMVWGSSSYSTYGDWSTSSYPSYSGGWGSYSSYTLMKVKDKKAKALANLQKKTKSVQSVKLPKHLAGDATDLMQTSKSLKK